MTGDGRRSARPAGGKQDRREAEPMAGNGNDKAPHPAVDIGYLAVDLPFLTRTLRAQIRAETISAYSDLELELGEIAIINLIGINPGISQNDLAAAVVLKKSAVTKLVKSLEERGLVARNKVAGDKRYNALTLTGAGEEKRGRLRQRMQRQHEDIMGIFSPREQQQLFGMLNRLAEHLRARRRALGGAPEETPSGEDV